jgi:hypothetical protein
MAPGKPRDEHKQERWRRWIAQWQTSGLSVTAFCARHRLATASFYAWRRTLQRRAAERPTFLPIEVVADTPPARGGVLEVVLADGRCVRVPPGFDAATLRQLLAVLREDRPC